MLLLLLLHGANAHDYWLDAEPDALDQPGPVALHLHLGQELVSESDKPHLTDRTVSFRHLSAGDAVDLSPADGSMPAWSGDLRAPGGHLFALERNHAWIELPAPKFNDYLEHEGLSAVSQARQAAGQADQVGRERYTRYLKVWVPVGPVSDAVHARPVGHALEITLHAVPVAGAELPVTVRFQGRPLGDHPLTAYVRRADDPTSVQSHTLRTNDQGTVRFPAAAEGDWLVRTVHAQPCVGCERADWESFWAAYRFPVRSASEPEPAPPPAPQPQDSRSICGCGHTASPVWGLGVLALLLGRRRRG